MGRIVPFRHVANERRGIVCAVCPLDFTGASPGRIENVSQDHHHWNAIAERVIDAHGRVLRADGAVTSDERWPAGDLRVTVSHGCRKIFVGREDELGIFVLSIVDDGFLQRHVRVCRHTEHIFETQTLDDIDHEVRARLVDSLGFIDGNRGGGCSRPPEHRRRRVPRYLGRLRNFLRLPRCRSCNSDCGTRGRRFQESASIFRFDLRLFSHGRAPRAGFYQKLRRAPSVNRKSRDAPRILKYKNSGCVPGIQTRVRTRIRKRISTQTG